VTGSPGASAAASGPPNTPKAGASAADVPLSAATGAAVEPARADFGPQAARLRVWRVAGVTIWLAPSAPSRSAATKRGAGQFVKRASEADGDHVPVTAIREPRSPATGKGPPSLPAGAAGLAVLREGWKPVWVETRAEGPGLDAQHDSPAPRSGDAPQLLFASRAAIPKRAVRASASSCATHLPTPQLRPATAAVRSERAIMQ
jgi:hypothetical protein